MTLPESPLDIVVLCNKSDVYLTRICIASIRYYYPTIPIHIVKDELNGRFSTTELETAFDVKVLDLGMRRYGWCTGTIALLLADMPGGKKILLLDSDIVFIGRVLDKLVPELGSADFIVSPEYGNDPESEWFSRTYYNSAWALEFFPDHSFPGYTFNCGQMVVTPGVVHREEVADFVDMSRYPYWTEMAAQHLPCRDQSLLNILLPLKHKRGEARVRTLAFQYWSESPEVKHGIELRQVTAGVYPYLIHWAGAVRVPYLKRMTRGDILKFFEEQYYNRLPLGTLRKALNDRYQVASYHLGRMARDLLSRLRRK